MKSTGMVRRLDQLGRIVIPKEIRETFDIQRDTPLEIYADEEEKYILLRKYQPGCIFCDSVKNLVRLNGRNVCKKCLDRLKELE